MRFAPIAVLCSLVCINFAAARTVRITAKVPADTPADAAIYVAGNLPAVGRWSAQGLKLSRQSPTTFTGDLEVTPPQTLEFKLNRGSWETVEKAVDGQERPNRVAQIDAGTMSIDVVVDRWANEPAAVKHTLTGDLKVTTIDSAALRRPVTLRVWLPPGYDADAAARYDVLYLHDGQNCFDRATAAFGQEWDVDESLTKLIAAKTIRPIIAVGIDNGGASRIDDYTFAPDPGEHRGGQADAYARCLLDEIIPHINKAYRTQTGSAHTLLGGSSLGGLVTLEIARRHPGTFGGLLVMSPSLWWNGEQLSKDLTADAKSLANARIWLDIGTFEQPMPAGAKDVERVRALAGVLERSHVAHRLTIDPGAQHNEAAWANRFPEATTYLLTP